MLTAMDGSYVLEPVDGGTRVTYALGVDVKVPMLGAMKRAAEKRIVEGALLTVGSTRRTPAPHAGPAASPTPWRRS